MIKDIGLPSPESSEEIVRILMSEEIKEQYSKADGSADMSGLFRWTMGEMKREDGTGKGAISVKLNTALHRANATL